MMTHVSIKFKCMTESVMNRFTEQNNIEEMWYAI